MNTVIGRQAQRYGFAILSTLLATWVRVHMHDLVEDRVPFGLYFLSVLLTAWVAGTGPAILALAGGIAAAAHWVIPPADSWKVTDAPDQIALGIYGIVGAVAIVLFHRSAVEAELLQQRARENEELSARLRDADHRKDEFLALLAHELRNPLAPIRSGLMILDREDQISDAGRQTQLVIRRQVDQLIRIVDDLLDVSRFLRGRFRINRDLIDLREVVDLAVHTVEPLVEEHHHHLRFVRPQQPVVVAGDEVRLTQAVANLLTNAVRYTPRNGRIRVILDVSDGEANLQVSDNGIGIPLDAQRYIFDLFAQGNPSETRDQGGLGLGLAIVRQILELHSGSVSVASDGPGRGSCFTIKLPLADVATIERLHHTQPKSKEKPEDANPERRVMIVDDNCDAAQTLALLLSFDGYLTQIANDGLAALNCYDDFAPDVVLLDIGMPGMDGYEVARRLRSREEGRRSQIIAVTGWGHESDRRRSREAGIDHHLVKPVDLPTLMRLIVDCESDALTAEPDANIR